MGAPAGPSPTQNEKGREVSLPAFSVRAVLKGSGAGDFGRIDLEARAHRRGQRDLANVLALGARGLGLDDRIDERVDVGLQVGDRKSVVEGTSVAVRVDIGGRRTIKKETT